MEGDGLGLRSVTFEVQVSESSTTHTVELDDNAITFLHEELLKHSGDAPRIQGQKWRLFESERFVEERRRSYENYLNDVVLSPSCVDKGIVWVTLGVDSASATTHRFLIRGDNIQQLEELSLIDPERLLTTGVLSVLSRLVQDRANDLTVVSSAVTVLLRVLSRPGTSKLITETSVVPSLLRCLFQTSTPLIIQLIADTCVRLITAHPQSLFWYFQRDSGLTELIDIIDTCKACPHAIQGLSEIVWVGITQSRDIELAVTDKSSVGMSLLNKLLVKGEGTESELVVTCTLAYLFVRGQVAEFSDKINHIISSYMSGDLAHSYRLNFVENMPRFLYLLGKPESPVLPENEQVIQLGCHVIVSKCLIDPTFFDRTLVRPPLTRRLRQIVFTGSEVDEKTRSRCAEALVVLGGPDLGSPENLTNTLEMEKFIYTLNAKLIGDKIHKLNNFFIEANFDLSSRVVTDTIGNDHTAAVLHYAEEIDDMVKSIDAEQTQLQVIHTKALNEVVSGMFQLKSMQKEIESVTTTDLSTERGVQQLEDYAKELKKLESIPDPSPEVLTKARELKVEIVDSAPAREVMAKRSAILKTIRNVNVQVMNLDSETFASLVEAVKQIENRSESSHRQIAQLKVLLVKIKHQVDDLLEQIDADTASSPVSP